MGPSALRCTGLKDLLAALAIDCIDRGNAAAAAAAVSAVAEARDMPIELINITQLRDVLKRPSACPTRRWC